MPLISAGLFDSNGDALDSVRSTEYAKEANVTGGTTVTDGGSSRNIAQTAARTTSGGRIPLGALSLGTAFTVAVRFRYNTAAWSGYASVVARGGVFINASRIATGIRDNGNGFMYGKNGSTLVGTEGSPGFTFTNGNIYTLLARVNTTDAEWYCYGGSASVIFDNVAMTGTDGSQDVYLGGASTVSASDPSGNFELLAWAIYDERINDTVRNTIAASSGAGIYDVIPAYVTGPTITVQPTAQTARLNGDATTTATFSVTATGTGGLTYDWELETSVGGGVYANLADGNGATWTGQAASSCVGTFTAKTLSGRRVRCNVTDSNGTTTTDAVVLTVLDGPVLSAASATTNGSGVASVTMTSDDALTANGEILLVTATVRGQVVARTTVRPA